MRAVLVYRSHGGDAALKHRTVIGPREEIEYNLKGEKRGGVWQQTVHTVHSSGSNKGG